MAYSISNRWFNFLLIWNLICFSLMQTLTNFWSR